MIIRFLNSRQSYCWKCILPASRGSIKARVAASRTFTIVDMLTCGRVVAKRRKLPTAGSSSSQLFY